MRKFELFFSYLAVILCVSLTLYLWGWISTFQPLWPFPALYLVELAVLAIVAFYFSIRDLSDAASVIWAIAGAYLAFFFLAGFSIGLFYFPFVILYLLIGFLSERRHNHKNFLPHLGSLAAGALIQGALVLVILKFIILRNP